MVDALRGNLKEAMENCEEQKYEDDDIQFALSNIYVRQIDYTQDISGFVMFVELFPLLREYGHLIDMEYCRNDEYKQLLTCI